MNPVLLAPLWLGALVALAVPLLVHLRRRTEAVPTDFAALRWLDPRPRPRARVRFDEWLLLALRLLLVALLALLLARPAAFGLDDRTPRMLVVPGVRAPVMTGAQWLAPGFPAISTPTPAGPVPLASLLRQYDAELPAGVPLTIVVPAVIDGLDAAPLRLTRSVRWRVAAGALPRPASAPSVAPVLAVRSDPDAPAVRYFRAAAAAWGTADRFAASADDHTPADGTVLVWLRRDPPPAEIQAWVSRGGTALVAADSRWALPSAEPVWRDPVGASLAEAATVGRGRVVRLTRALTPAALPELLDADFPQQLRALVTSPAPPPDRARAADVAPTAGVAPFPLPPRDLTPWLALAIAALFLVERWLAAGPRRGKA